MALMQHFQCVCFRTSSVERNFRQECELISCQVRCQYCHTSGSSPDHNILLHGLLQVTLNDKDHLQVNTKGAKPASWDGIYSAGPDMWTSIFRPFLSVSSWFCFYSPCSFSAINLLSVSKSCSQEM